jgi:sugar transferase (PEP-CTERM system associated)
MYRILNQYISAKTLLLLVQEGVLIVLSVLCAVKLRFWRSPEELATYVAYPDFYIQCGAVLVVCLLCFYCNDLYEPRHSFGTIERLLRIEQSIGTASLLLGMLYFLFPRLLLSRGVLVIAMVLAAIFAIIGRKILDRAWQLTTSAQHVLILGTGPLAMDLAREISLREDLTIRLDGFISGAPDAHPETVIAGMPVLGTASQVAAIVRGRPVSRIIVALEDRRGVLPVRDLVSLRVRGICIDDAATVLAALTGRVSLNAVRPSWFVFSHGFHRSQWHELLKRSVDLGCALVGFALSAPVLVLVALAVRLDSNGPVIYRQTRVGRMGKTFDVLKFRSMRADAEKVAGAQWAQKNDPRVTRIGRFLRKYRLDELPQLWNVIRGDMSFVGPRPERPCFVEELRTLIPYYDERHSVRPGLTGWAQVQYSYGSTIEDALKKLEYDLFYLQNMSLTLDLAIIVQTVRTVTGGHGAQ